ncbi:hypothetical protein, partial [Nonomuraea sp. LPB2021202275-12-8]|uniref:hypothetical protein n=1 Tax=Nonomuraea sp. LPB2021202275-12-8 TaxID=3120159 RepID=UPI00300D517D
MRWAGARTSALVCAMAVVVVSSTVMAYGNQADARPLDLLGHVLLVATAAGLAWLPGRPAPALVAMFAAIAAGRRAGGGRRAGRRPPPRPGRRTDPPRPRGPPPAGGGGGVGPRPDRPPP